MSQSIGSLINWAVVRQYFRILTGRDDPNLAWRLISDAHKGSSVACLGATVKDMQSRIEAAQNNSYGIFTTINAIPIQGFLPSMVQNSSKITQLRAMVIDADDVALPDQWTVVPTMLMIRDARHWHAYWVLDEASQTIANAARWSALQYQLALYYGTDLCIHDIGRVMRVPGTFNCKDPTNPILTQLHVLREDSKFDMEFLEKSHPLQDHQKPLVQGFRTIYKTSETAIELDTTASVSIAKARLQAESPPIKDQGSTMKLYRAAAEIKELGVSVEMATALIGVWAEAGGTYSRYDDKIHHQVQSAYKYAQVKEPIYSPTVFPAVDEELQGGIEAIVAKTLSSDSWTNLLQRDKNGRLVKNLFNVGVFFEHHPELKGRFARDIFAHKDLVMGKLDFYEWLDNEPIHYMEDAVTQSLRVWLARECHFEPTVTDIQTALDHISRKNAFHPVKDYLESNVWDGKPRLRKWLTTYLGAPANEYIEQIGEMTLVAAVARIYEPGVKYDHMLILEGITGTGKSSVFNILGGQWFGEITKTDPSDKDMLMQCHGNWLLEWAELKSMRALDVRDLKSFITRQVDEFRRPYDRYTVPYPRRFILVGTTNDREYLQDETGARRFLIAEAKNVDFSALKRDRNQIWAEAVVKYRAGYKLYMPEHLKKAAAEVADQRYVDDAWEESINEFVTNTLKTSEFVKVKEIWTNCLYGSERDCSRGVEMRIAKILKKMGLTKFQKYVGGTVFKAWKREE